MGKKRWSSAEWRTRTAKRQDAALVSSRRDKEKRKRNSHRPAWSPEGGTRAYSTFAAPSNFSVINNPEAVISFLHQLDKASWKYNLMIDFSGVKNLTSDSVVALVAQLELMKTRCHISGVTPRDSNCARVLADSGFFELVKVPNPPTPSKKGRLLHKKSKMVEATTAAELIKLGTTALYGKWVNTLDTKATYCTLLEAMGNTHEHAADVEGTEQWWASVYVDTDLKKVCYCFVDMGVGIFRSVKVETLKKVIQLLSGKDNTDLLRDLLEGTIPSSTGLAYRGKGLPKINEHAKNLRIKSLVIISNDVYANVLAGDFRKIRVPFEGTFLYWEN